MSPLEIWCNESQERYVLAVPAERLAVFQALCERERCPFALVGQAHRLDRGVPRSRECGLTSGQHTRPQFGGVELYRTVGSARDRYCHLRQAQHLGTVDDHRLGGRRALIDREDGHRLRH